MNTIPQNTLPQPGVATWNRWFDRVPRMQILVGHRTLPAFRSIGIMGFHVAFTAALLTSLLVDFSLLVAVGVSATAALSFFGWALLRRAATGAESLVLLEHVWVAIASVGAYLWLAGAPILTGLDVLCIALAPFLAFGRLGCFTVGCCHGTPTATGVRYGPAHDHLPPWLVGRRLRPVALLEAAGLLTIFAIGLALARYPAGSATVWFLAAYAVLRFGTEALRGDQRPHVGPVSVARLMSMLQLGGAVALAGYVESGRWARSFDPSNDSWPLLAVRATPILVALVVGGALALLRGRQTNPLVDHRHLLEAWRMITTAATTHTGRGAPTMAVTSLGLDIGVSAISHDAVHVSLDHPGYNTAAVATVFADEVTHHHDIDHVIVKVRTAWSDDATADINGHAAPVSNGAQLERSLGYFTHSVGD